MVEINRISRLYLINKNTVILVVKVNISVSSYYSERFFVYCLSKEGCMGKNNSCFNCNVTNGISLSFWDRTSATVLTHLFSVN